MSLNLIWKNLKLQGEKPSLNRRKLAKAVSEIQRNANQNKIKGTEVEDARFMGFTQSFYELLRCLTIAVGILQTE